MSKLTLILFLFVIYGSSRGQSTNTADFERLISREWALKFYEQDGEKFPPAPEQKNDRMIFYPDHKAKAIESGGIQNGIWEYDSNQMILSVVDNDTKEKMDLTVISITQDACLLEFVSPDGEKIRMHMVAIKP